MKGSTLMDLLTWNPELFTNCVVPEGMVPYKQELFDQIVMDNHDLVCYYEEPRLFTQMTEHFFSAHLKEFERLWHTYVVEYDPIENYNRFTDNWDKSKDEFDKNDSHTTTLGTTVTDTTDMTRTDNLNENRNLTNTAKRVDNLEEEHTISAMNSSSYQPDNKIDNTGDSTTTTTDTGDIKNTGDVKNKGTVARKGTGSDVLKIEDDDENRHEGEFHEHTHGNIGVTTTQQMLQQERDLNRWNIYEYISSLYAEKLLMRIYSGSM